MTEWRPPHAHWPGITPRHAEGLFDAFRTVRFPLEDAPGWQAGLAFLRDGFFWEAHEVWEPLWMAAPPNGPERCLLRGLIQAANAGLKRAMGRPRAAARLDAIAGRALQEAFARARGGRVMGLSSEECFDLCNIMQSDTDI